MWQIVLEIWRENPFFVVMVICLIILALSSGEDDLSH